MLPLDEVSFLSDEPTGQDSSGRTVVDHLADQIVPLIRGSLGMAQRDVTIRAKAARATPFVRLLLGRQRLIRPSLPIKPQQSATLQR